MLAVEFEEQVLVQRQGGLETCHTPVRRRECACFGA